MSPEIIPVLQTAIGPVILISGIGLLLLTMTNRLARTVDRARAFSRAESSSRVEGQLAILWERARVLRMAILWASLSAFCAALLVILLFVSVLLDIAMTWAIAVVFILGMLFLIGALLFFIRDVNRSLAALRLELDGRERDRP